MATVEPGPQEERQSDWNVAGPVLIVVPSLLSGAGLVLILISIFLSNEIAQKVLLSIGVISLWLDFFTTMAVFRYSSRSINRRLRRLELSVDARERAIRGRGAPRAEHGEAPAEEPGAN